MKGYEEAEKIDKQINNLLEKTPVTKETYAEYLILARTLMTTCEIITMSAIKVFEQVTNEKAALDKNV